MLCRKFVVSSCSQEDLEFSRVDVVVHRKITKTQEGTVEELRNIRLEMQRRCVRVQRALQAAA